MSKPYNLVLERKDQKPDGIGPNFMITPALDENYWLYRVRVAEGQAILGFPKFSVIGIGFAVEEDWNTNLPSNCGAKEIYEHIKHNAGGPIPEHEVIRAIEMVKAAVLEDQR